MSERHEASSACCSGVGVDCGLRAGTESYSDTLAIVFLPCSVLISAFVARTAAVHFFFPSVLGAGRGTFALRLCAFMHDSMPLGRDFTGTLMGNIRLGDLHAVLSLCWRLQV